MTVKTRGAIEAQAWEVTLDAYVELLATPGWLARNTAEGQALLARLRDCLFATQGENKAFTTQEIQDNAERAARSLQAARIEVAGRVFEANKPIAIEWPGPPVRRIVIMPEKRLTPGDRTRSLIVEMRDYDALGAPYWKMIETFEVARTRSDSPLMHEVLAFLVGQTMPSGDKR